MSDPFQFDPQKVLLNARGASTEDLLNRVTAFRDGMEPEAVQIIEAELDSRGVGARDIEAHAEKLRERVIVRDGLALRCSFCERPAVAQGWGWHRLWRKLPVFPRLLSYCSEHRPH